METWIINNRCVEFFPEDHAYLVDGIELPSVTTILKVKFGNKYQGVSREMLNKAAELGTQMHATIQNYEEQGIDSDLKELRNYKFLKKHYGWECLENERPVILFDNNIPIACGQVDMVARIDDKIGLFDFKRTSTLDKNYLGFQLNIYRIAYQQCYGIEIDFLRGVHLRENVRKVVEIPINELETWNLIYEFMEGNE